MKEKKKELEYSFSPLVLYLDDLEKLEDCFKKAGFKIEIETKKYIFESVGELRKQLVEKKLKPYLTQLSFQAKKQTKKDFFEEIYGWLRFSPKVSPRFHFEEDNIESRGILSKIQTLLKEKRRKSVLNDKYIPLILFFGFLLSGVITPFLAEAFIQKKTMVVIIGMVFIIFFWYWFIWSLIINKKESALIILKRKEQNSFWQRNKEKIFWRIIVPACMLILGIIISSLLNK